MEELPDPETVRGKYKGLFKGRKSIAQIEEDQEEFIEKHGR